MIRWLRPTLLLIAAATAGLLLLRDPAPAEALAASPPVLAAPAAQAPATVAVVPPPEASSPKVTVALNDAILRILATYGSAEGHPYAWQRGRDTDGVTQELFWRGTLLAAPEAGGGIHCSGITFEVYLRALAEVVGEEHGPDVETLLAMKNTWYVRDGDTQGPVDALVKAGLGLRRKGLAEFQPGDIVQFWRNNGKGHSVVFINHTWNSDGSLRGMIYWSAQGTSGGVGMRRTSPGPDINQIAPGRLYGVSPIWTPGG